MIPCSINSDLMRIKTSFEGSAHSTVVKKDEYNVNWPANGNQGSPELPSSRSLVLRIGLGTVRVCGGV